MLEWLDSGQHGYTSKYTSSLPILKVHDVILSAARASCAVRKSSTNEGVDIDASNTIRSRTLH